MAPISGFYRKNSAVPAGQVVISVLVTNSGESEGSYEVILKIDGAEEARKEVTLSGGKDQTVSFIIGRDATRKYAVNVNGEVGQFTIVALPELPASEPTPVIPVEKQTNWLLIVGIIGGLLLLGAGAYIMLIARRKART